MTSAKGRSVQRGAIRSAVIALGLIVFCGLSVAANTEPSGAQAPSGRLAATEKKARPAPVKPVDINSASRSQLKTLPGIGDAEAGRIIAGRPYLSKADLASKKVIPTGVYLSLKDRVIAIQRQKPKGKD